MYIVYYISPNAHSFILNEKLNVKNEVYKDRIMPKI